jgi:hypothetical protein
MKRLSELTDIIYVHVDMDVLDPAEVSGHPLTVPNGPTSRELAAAISEMFRYQKAAAFGVASTPAGENDKGGFHSRRLQLDRRRHRGRQPALTSFLSRGERLGGALTKCRSLIGVTVVPEPARIVIAQIDREPDPRLEREEDIEPADMYFVPVFGVELGVSEAQIRPPAPSGESSNRAALPK